MKKTSEVQHKEMTCLVPVCVETTIYPMVHAFQAHVPGIFDKISLPPSNELFLRVKRNASHALKAG